LLSLLRIRIAEKQRQLVRRKDINELAGRGEPQSGVTRPLASFGVAGRKKNKIL
jgi:hypothetical protein